jgi:cytochrome c556
MIRKWSAFVFSAVLLVTAGAGVSLVAAFHDDDTPLGKLMEKVNKANGVITKGTRSKVNYNKAQKDVVTKAKELAKLAKEAKPFKDALKHAKDEAEPQKKWDLLMDEFEKSSVKLSEVAEKPDSYDDAKKEFATVKKSCVDCHKIFKNDE